MKVATLPTVADGDYHVIAKATGAGATEGISAPAGTVNIAAPFVDLSGAIAGYTPTSPARGKKATVAVSILNSGNIPLKQIIVAVYAGLAPTPGDGDVPIPSVPVKLNLKAGATKATTVKIVLPTALPAGTYYFNAALDLSAAVTEKFEDNNVAVGGGTFMV